MPMTSPDPMDITTLITAEQVVTLPAQAKPQLLDTLARRAAAALHITETTILNAILQREALGSTGVGQGVAIPHARVAGLGHFFGLFTRLDQAVDFAAVDGQPVDLVFLLLMPAHAGKEHLAALAAISRRLRDRDTQRRLRAAGAARMIYDALTAAPRPSGPAGHHR
jgi:PTS system nitrogen regulatory IIA component